jgi:hypothetical protein
MRLRQMRGRRVALDQQVVDAVCRQEDRQAEARAAAAADQDRGLDGFHVAFSKSVGDSAGLRAEQLMEKSCVAAGARRQVRSRSARRSCRPVVPARRRLRRRRTASPSADRCPVRRHPRRHARRAGAGRVPCATARGCLAPRAAVGIRDQQEGSPIVQQIVRRHACALDLQPGHAGGDVPAASSGGTRSPTDRARAAAFRPPPARPVRRRSPARHRDRTSRRDAYRRLPACAHGACGRPACWRTGRRSRCPRRAAPRPRRRWPDGWRRSRRRSAGGSSSSTTPRPR